MRSIRGKRALVTGAASGIGRAIAVRLAEQGADLFLVDIDEPGLANVVAEARQAGVEAIGYRCDVARSEQISAAVASVLNRWGGVDILVNNAGVTYYGHTDRMTADQWDRILRIDLLSHIQFTRELLPSLLARREAHLLNVASILGLVPMPKLTAYCTMKAALVAFSESLRAELGREGLGVTVLCPGFVNTNLFQSALREDRAREPKRPPTMLCTTPDQVAAAALKAIRRNRRLVVVEPLARTFYGLKRFAPGLLDFAFHLGRRKRIKRKLARLAEETPVRTLPFPRAAIAAEPGVERRRLAA